MKLQHCAGHDSGDDISCEQLVAFCLDFLEGSLSNDERLHFEAHLARCGGCVTFFETYRRTPEVSRQALALQLPDKVKDSVRSFLRARYHEE